MAAEVGDDAWPAQVRVTYSERRRRTASARVEGDTVVLLMPAGIAKAEEEQIADKLIARLRAGRLRQRLNSADALQTRAEELNRRYFGGRLHWASIEYVTDQERRLGSCTPSTGKMRISHRLASVPEWVRDYVIVHELAHLEHPHHGKSFWASVNRFQLAERARGYLLALDLRGDADDEEL